MIKPCKKAIVIGYIPKKALQKAILIWCKKKAIFIWCILELYLYGAFRKIDFWRRFLYGAFIEVLEC